MYGRLPEPSPPEAPEADMARESDYPHVLFLSVAAQDDNSIYREGCPRQ